METFLMYLLGMMILTGCVMETTASAIQFSSSGPVTPLLTETLSMKCSINVTSHPPISGAVVGRRRRDVAVTVTETSETVHPMAILILNADGQQVASVTQYSGARSHMADPNMHVTGSVEGNPGNHGFLNVHWDYPTNSQIGKYKCEVNTLDDYGHGVWFAKNITVTGTEPSINDLVQHIHKLQIANQNLVGVIDSLKSETKANISRISHIESGFVDCGDSRNNPWTSGTDEFGRSRRIHDITQTFQKAYDSAPIVHISVAHPAYALTHHASTGELDYGVTIHRVDAHSFVARCSALHEDGFLWHLRATWVSFSN